MWIRTEWYNNATKYFMSNRYDIEFGYELGFVEEQLHITKVIRAGLDSDYCKFNRQTWKIIY